jgi:hypothetical protein
MRNARAWLWLLPFLAHAESAHAWGLYTHVYFAQLLVWSIPLADPAFRRAARRFPRLLMAGACLPDLALFGRHLGTQAFAASHRWETAQRLASEARSDEERALAAGLASHLVVDVIAHNHFVPAHERLWVNVPMLTHAVAEWAMDAHIARHLFDTPGQAMRHDPHVLTDYVGQAFGCPRATAEKGLRWLGNADRLLRGARLPGVLHVAGRLMDRRLRRRFDYYLHETAARLPQIDRVLAGEQPRWFAENLDEQGTRERIAALPRGQVRDGGMPLPNDYFEGGIEEEVWRAAA